MKTHTYACRGSIDLVDQLDSIDNYLASARLPPLGPCCTFGERPGHLADWSPLAQKSTLARRPEGGRLFNLLQLGDHVVFSSPRAAFRSFDDWQESTARLSGYGITLHFAEDGQAISPGDPVIGDAALFRWLRGELVGHRSRISLLADAAGIPIVPRRRANRFPIQRLEELTRSNTGPGGRIYPYVRTSLRPETGGEPGFAEQEKSVRGQAKLLAEARGDRTVEATRLDDSVRTAGFRFMDCPKAAEILQSVGGGDVVIVHSVPVAFRSMADLAATDWFLRVRGASLVIVEENLDTATRAGRRLADSLASLSRLQVLWQLPAFRGESTRALPAYLREEQVRGKVVLRIDGDRLRAVRSVQKFAAKGWPAWKIARRLESLETSTFGDGVLIPAEGLAIGSASAERLHPDHGVRGRTRIRRRWKLGECRRMLDRSYWLELEKLAVEQGFRRAPRVRWPKSIP